MSNVLCHFMENRFSKFRTVLEIFAILLKKILADTEVINTLFTCFCQLSFVS